MNGLRVLLTNGQLMHGGADFYVRDLALALLHRGHTPIVYSTVLGNAAEDLRQQTIPVVDNLEAVGAPPDIIHGQGHLETVTALLRFPSVPAVYFLHDNLAPHSKPPKWPRILRYVAVDETCRDRMVFEYGIPENRAQVLLNAVDLTRFTPRAPLPSRPARALVFSNHSSYHLHAVRAACDRAGLILDVIGQDSNNICTQPETMLGQYDIVFAKARCALEAMAVGAAVILCDFRGAGPMVTSGEFDRLRHLNFGHRALNQPHDPAVIAREIARYDAADAMEVSRQIRATAGLHKLVDDILALYDEVLDEFAEAGAPNAEAEARAAAAYLRWVSEQWRAEQNQLLETLFNRIKHRVLRLPPLKATRSSVAQLKAKFLPH